MNIALIGYGKMGKAIENIATEKGHTIVCKITSANAIHLPQLIKEADVAIEFSAPHTAADNLKKCFDAGIPVVCGTTGWMKQMDEVKQYCTEKNGTLLYASNFSIGVHLFFSLNVFLAEKMKQFPQYTPSIKEIHHTHKKDAPSGTAISLAQQIISANTSFKDFTLNNPCSDKITIISERKDPAPGTHHVLYHSLIDDIEIVHTAHSRTGFAAGAILSAEFLIGKRGLFNLKDVLGF